MPGSSISVLLQPASYETFYRLAHSYSEDLLTNAAFIKGASDLLARAIDFPPKQEFTSEAELTQLKDHIHALKASAAELQEAIRACFWPHVTQEMKRGELTRQAHDLDEVFNRERWTPYDGDAWDRFFTALVEKLQPPLTAFKQLAQSLNELDNPIVDSLGVALKEVRVEIQNRINKLELLLDAAQLETLYGLRE